MSGISVRNWISSIADRGRELLDLPLSTPQDPFLRLATLCHDLVSQKGEARGTALAREVVRGWEKSGARRPLAFLRNDAKPIFREQG